MTQNQWEAFAREDADWYVQTDTLWTGQQGSLFEHGQDLAQGILGAVAPHLPGRGLVVEIGSGVGRIAVHMAREFDRVIGVDIAPTMLERLRTNCAGEGRDNVVGLLPDEAWDAPASADLVYSTQVFQHIDDAAVISSYVRRAARALVPRGVLYLHVDTRPRTAGYRLRAAVPDALLPKPWRRGIRRIRRSPDRYRRLIASTGLTVLHEAQPGTDWHVIVAQRG
jgi:SAM-dependent methyltransferase